MPARRFVVVGVADPWDGQGNVFIVIGIATYPYARREEGERGDRCAMQGGGRKKGGEDGSIG